MMAMAARALTAAAYDPSNWFADLGVFRPLEDLEEDEDDGPAVEDLAPWRNLRWVETIQAHPPPLRTWARWLDGIAARRRE